MRTGNFFFIKHARLLSASVLALAFCVGPLSACTDASSPASSAVGPAVNVSIHAPGSQVPDTPAPNTGLTFVQSQIQQEINAPLNASDTYALTSDDLQLLQTNQLLSAADAQTFHQLLKQ